MEPLPPVDLLVFGPHPDDLEIGLGGTIALHAARGFKVGLCDLTRGELGSNGTPEEREAEAEAARAVLGASWRTNLRWPDGGIDGNDVQMIGRGAARSHSRGHGRSRCRTGTIGIPIIVAASDVLTRAVFKSGLRRFDDAALRLAARLDLLLLHQRFCAGVVRVDVSAHYEKKREALACHRIAVHAVGPGQRRDAPDRADVPADDREPRRAVRRADRRRVRGRGDRARSAAASAPVQGLGRLGDEDSSERRHRVLRIGRRQRDCRDRAREIAGRARASMSTFSAADTPFRFGAYQRGPEFPPGVDAGVSAVPRNAIRPGAGHASRPGLA